jgi:hypothetical protein
MEFSVYCMPDKRVVVVTKREVGEDCSKIRQTSGNRILTDEKTGPDSDDVHEST